MPSKLESGVKKLVSVLATFMPVTGTRKKAVETAEVGKDSAESKSKYPNLVQVSCIRYPITFWKKSVSALFDLGDEVNAIHLTLARELELFIRPMDFPLDPRTLEHKKSTVSYLTFIKW